MREVVDSPSRARTASSSGRWRARLRGTVLKDDSVNVTTVRSSTRRRTRGRPRPYRVIPRQSRRPEQAYACVEELGSRHHGAFSSRRRQRATPASDAIARCGVRGTNPYRSASAFAVGGWSPGARTPLSVAPRRCAAIRRCARASGATSSGGVVGCTCSDGRAGMRAATDPAARWSASDDQAVYTRCVVALPPP